MIIEGAIVEDVVGHAAKDADLGVGAARDRGGDIGIDPDRGVAVVDRGGDMAAEGVGLARGHEAEEVEGAGIMIDVEVGLAQGREAEEVEGGGIGATVVTGVWIERTKMEVPMEKKTSLTTQKMTILRIVNHATKKAMTEGTMIVEAIVMTLTVITIIMINGTVDTWMSVI